MDEHAKLGSELIAAPFDFGVTGSGPAARVSCRWTTAKQLLGRRLPFTTTTSVLVVVRSLDVPDLFYPGSRFSAVAA